MRKFILSIVVLIISVYTLSALAAVAGDHPAYVKALADLRAARWLIDHHLSKDWVPSRDEAAAVREIDATISEIKYAAIPDHKDVNAHVNSQEGSERLGRLRAALDLLRRTREDIARREDDQFANDLRACSFEHIDEAIRAIERDIAAK